jgi:hypothetical protein
MKCPHCDAILPFILCSECRGEIPEKSRYCCWCGNTIPVEEKENDFSKRVLCSDGSCIGVINEDGFCSICKKPYTGEPV